MTPLTNLSSLVQEWQQLKQHLTEQGKQFQEYCRPYRERQDAIEAAIHAFLNENKLQNVKTEHGTAYKTVATTPKIEDRTVFLDFCLDNWDDGGNELLQLGAPQIDAFRNYIADREKYLEEMRQRGQLPNDLSLTPPGTSVSYYEKVNIRKA